MPPFSDCRLGWPPALLIIDTPSEYASPGRTPAKPVPLLDPNAAYLDLLETLYLSCTLPLPTLNSDFDDIPF